MHFACSVRTSKYSIKHLTNLVQAIFLNQRFARILTLTTILWVCCSFSVYCAAITSNGVCRGSPTKNKRHCPEKCQAGKEYRITSVDDLKENTANLQCIFWAAEEPSKVPEGPLYGRSLSLGNVEALNPTLEKFWKGKFIQEIKCQWKQIFLGWNRVFGQPNFPFLAYLGKISDHTNAHPQYRDTKVSLMIDYRKDLATVCPDLVEMNGRSFETLRVLRSPVHKNFYPTNQILDVVRFVGRQKDGGAVLLGQVFLEDYFSVKRNSKPVAFFALVVHDPELNKDFMHGQPLKPLESDLNYRNRNFLDILAILIPVDNLLTEPIHATRVMALEVVPAARDFGNFIWDACCLSDGDTERLSAEFVAHQPNVTSMNETRNSKFISIHEDFHSHLNEL